MTSASRSFRYIPARGTRVRVSAAGLLGQSWGPFPENVAGFLSYISGVGAARRGKIQHQQLAQVKEPSDDPVAPGPSGLFWILAMCAAAVSLSPSSQIVKHSMATRVLAVAWRGSSMA
jgi:hypothetical protein